MSADLSIIVQGPFKPATDAAGYRTVDVIQSARRHYPEAEIVYSGWQGTELPAEATATIDAVVLSADPGPVVTFHTPEGDVVENINRQIVSTVAGLRRVTRPYAIKLRSDTLVVGNGWAGWRGRQLAKQGRTTLFEEPPVVASQFTRLFFLEYGGFRPCIAHLSDLFFFGRRSDLLRYWDLPPVVSSPVVPPDRKSAATVEQLLALRFLGKGPLASKFAAAAGDLDGAAWRSILCDNFVVLGEAALQVRHPARFVRLGISRFVFETDESIAALSGRCGRLRRLGALTPMAVAFGEYRLKSMARRMIGEDRYRGVTRSVTAAATRLLTAKPDA